MTNSTLTARARPGPTLVLALPLLVGAVRLAANLTDGFWAYGDLAVIELSVRNALRGDQLLGPYSRFGWDHPGPALFYLLAPVYWLAGSDTRALFLSTWVVNAASLLAVVAVVRRRAGRTAAWWGAAGLLAWLVCVGPAVVMSPWNPNAICLPFLLTLLLSAAAAAGSGWSVAGAAVAGSVTVQTHIGSLPLVAVLVTAGAAGWLAGRRLTAVGAAESRGNGRFLAGAAGLVAVLGALWAPPVAEQLTRDPGNVVLAARFFRDGPPPGIPTHHSLSDAAGTVARHVSAVPLGLDESDRLGRAGPLRLAVSGAWLLAAVGCALVGWGARHRFAFACGLFAALAGVVTVAAATRVVDALVPYLFVYTTTLPVAVMAGWGALAGAVAWPGLRSRVAAVAATVVVLAGGLASTGVVARAATEPEASSAEVAVTSGLAGDALEAAGVRRVMVRETGHDVWPVATGVLAALERRGYAATVDPLLVSLVGDAWAPTGREEAEVIVGQFDDPLPPGANGPAAAPLLGRAGTVAVWWRDARPVRPAGPAPAPATARGRRAAPGMIDGAGTRYHSPVAGARTLSGSPVIRGRRSSAP